MTDGKADRSMGSAERDSASEPPSSPVAGGGEELTNALWIARVTMSDPNPLEAAHELHDDEIVQVCRALLSSPRVEEWKPIGIAPRDGTRVLGFFPDHEDGLHDTNWSRHGVWASRAYPNQPTYWKSLPEPPALSPPQGE